MARVNTWSVHDVEGRYIGCSAAFAPETAFLQLMLMLGRPIDDDAVEFEAVDESLGWMTVGAELFRITTLDIWLPAVQDQ